MCESGTDEASTARRGLQLRPLGVAPLLPTQGTRGLRAQECLGYRHDNFCLLAALTRGAAQNGVEAD